MSKGFVSFILHAHLPFVRHPEHRDSLEERWFYEACTECYIPLLMTFKRLAERGSGFRITFSLSPTLLSMMGDDLLKERYLRYLDRAIGLGIAECDRNAGKKDFYILSRKYVGHLKNVRSFFLDCGGNLPLKFKELAAAGRLELITTSATHGFLPLIHSREARRAQVEVGIRCFEKVFGRTPPGFWLPECGYASGVDHLLRDAGIKYFILDTHGVISARPEPVYGIYGPVQTRAGVAVFGRDPESSRQVWERRAGYPGHPEYREFYRDIAYDLDEDYLGPYLPGSGLRVDTGFKYYRITGPGENREVYNPDAALKRAEIHAKDFILSRVRQLRDAAELMGRPPVIIAPYDAELFGHWWYEGPHWLENVLQQCGDGAGFKTLTPGDYLDAYPQNQQVDLTMSSWGEGGYGYVWLNPKNDWIYKHQHMAEVKMTELANTVRPEGDLQRRALNQACRELLLAQSSDWAFILKQGTTEEYAAKRVSGHLVNFNVLASQVDTGEIDEEFLSYLECVNNVFPDLDYGVFSSVQVRPGILSHHRLKVIMLSWEYPPRTVGGLGRHVHDLSRALSDLGVEVHVFTCPARGRPGYEIDNSGVHVYRVAEKDLRAVDFLEWLSQLNRGMVRLARENCLSRGLFHVIHAHDWLVRDAAVEIAKEAGIPLVATIHATEYGRNGGVVTELQRRIHNTEKDLVAIADRVICCSEYMAREVKTLFGHPGGGIKIVPNGVDASNMMVKTADGHGGSHRGDPRIMFIGRLVPEKGVQVLLESLPVIMEKYPGVVLTVAGKGPHEGQLRELAKRLGVAENVMFIGFINDEGRNRLLAESSVAVFPSIYEPFGIVALEAMAAGIPVVVSDTGGLSEIICHGIDGIKFPPGRVDLLARYVTELLDHPDQAGKLARNAYKKVLGQYSWKQIAFDTAMVYLEAAGGRAKKEEDFILTTENTEITESNSFP